MKEQYNKKLFMVIMLLLLAVISFSFAMYSVVFQGQKDNVITTKKISFSYAEPIESLNLYSYGLMSDTEGKQQSKYYQFDVKASSSIIEEVNYSIYIAKVNNEKNFSDSDIRFNLTKVVNNTESEVVTPSAFSSFSSFNNKANTKKIYQSTFSFDGINLEPQVHTYRLRFWLGENFDISSILETSTSGDTQNIKLNEYKYEFKINISTL